MHSSLDFKHGQRQHVYRQTVLCAGVRLSVEQCDGALYFDASCALHRGGASGYRLFCFERMQHEGQPFHDLSFRCQSFVVSLCTPCKTSVVSALNDASTNVRHTGSPYTKPEWWGLQERYPELQVLVSSLTAGPIAPGDGIVGARDLVATGVRVTVVVGHSCYCWRSGPGCCGCVRDCCGRPKLVATDLQLSHQPRRRKHRLCGGGADVQSRRRAAEARPPAVNCGMRYVY